MTHVLDPPAEIELCVSPISPVDPVSFESAMAAPVVSPKIANMIAATVTAAKIDFLESFLFLINSDKIQPFIEDETA
jgi:hypothetical protein